VRGDIKAILALIKLLDWFPVNNEDLRGSEMKENADKVRHKIEQMIRNRQEREAAERAELLTSLLGRKRAKRFQY
jgi:hypothetical protein